MKKILAITVFLISAITFSQTTSEYRMQRNKLLKEVNENIKSFGSGGGFENRYYPELKIIREKSYNWRNLNSTEIKNVISQMENLKSKYLKPNGSYRTYLKDVDVVNKKIKEVNELAVKEENSSKIYALDPTKTVAHRYIYDFYDEEIIWLNEHLQYKLGKGNSESSQSNIESTSNTNKVSDQQVNNNSISSNTNASNSTSNNNGSSTNNNGFDDKETEEQRTQRLDRERGEQIKQETEDNIARVKANSEQFGNQISNTLGNAFANAAAASERKRQEKYAEIERENVARRKKTEDIKAEKLAKEELRKNRKSLMDLSITEIDYFEDLIYEPSYSKFSSFLNSDYTYYKSEVEFLYEIYNLQNNYSLTLGKTIPTGIAYPKTLIGLGLEDLNYKYSTSKSVYVTYDFFSKYSKIIGNGKTKHLTINVHESGRQYQSIIKSLVNCKNLKKLGFIFSDSPDTSNRWFVEELALVENINEIFFYSRKGDGIKINFEGLEKLSNIKKVGFSPAFLFPKKQLLEMKNLQEISNNGDRSRFKKDLKDLKKSFEEKGIKVKLTNHSFFIYGRN